MNLKSVSEADHNETVPVLKPLGLKLWIFTEFS